MKNKIYLYVNVSPFNIGLSYDLHNPFKFAGGRNIFLIGIDL